MLHIKVKRMKHTISCKQIVCPYTHFRPLSGVERSKHLFSSHRRHNAYQMNRKVDHAHIMVIYSMDGLWGEEFPLTRKGTPVLHSNMTCTCSLLLLLHE